ncbi:hypothetical protein IWQ61_010649 [Dispira simplex]|nr:hypothetical protein IWQ61_010649 [Dispira simplex]
MTQMVPNVGSCVAEKWPKFDPEDIDSFLDEFEKQANTHGKIGKRRCTKLKECLPAEVTSKVIFFRGYKGGDWDMLKVYEGLISSRKTGIESDSLQSSVLIKCVPVEIIWKVKEHTIINKQIIPLMKLIEIVLDEAQNAQIWTDAERMASMHVDQAETIKAETREMEAPCMETKTELEKSEITQLMEELARLTLLVKGIRLEKP